MLVDEPLGIGMIDLVGRPPRPEKLGSHAVERPHHDGDPEAWLVRKGTVVLKKKPYKLGP